MRIVHVITGLEADGAENFLVRLCRKLDQHTHHVISLTTLGPAAAGLLEAGVPVEALGMTSIGRTPGKFVELTHRIGDLQPDIVHTWMYHSDLIGGLAARAAGVPRVAWSIRHSNLHWRDNKLTTTIIARLCAALSRRVPDAIVTNSANAKAIHMRIGYGSREFAVIPNGFELDRYRPDPIARIATREALGIADDTFLIGMFGRFNPQKGHEFFLEAASHLKCPSRKLHMLLGGRGIDEDNAAIREWIKSRNLQATTTLLGERKDMPAVLASLDLLVLSSIHGEAFPNIVGEAMACAVPCVVTDVGDCAFIVGDTAPVVAPRDTEALASAMNRLVDMDAAELGRVGARERQRVLEEFEIGSVVNRYADFYDRLAAHAT